MSKKVIPSRTIYDLPKGTSKYIELAGKKNYPSNFGSQSVSRELNKDFILDISRSKKTNIYTFPTKLFDYLHSKNIILTYKLEGVSKKIRSLFIEAFDDNDFKHKLLMLCQMDSLTRKRKGLESYKSALIYLSFKEKVLEFNKFIDKLWQ